jgi:hypothetical protein
MEQTNWHSYSSSISGEIDRKSMGSVRFKKQKGTVPIKLDGTFFLFLGS